MWLIQVPGYKSWILPNSGGYLLVSSWNYKNTSHAGRNSPSK